MAPLKIIKASASYQGARRGELSFEKGDFFYVIHDKVENEMYEVMNPVEKTRGVVHYRYFRNVAKNATEERREMNGGEMRNVEEYMNGLPSPEAGGNSRNLPPQDLDHRRVKDNTWTDDESDFSQRPSLDAHDAFNDYYEDEQYDAPPPQTSAKINNQIQKDPNGLSSCLVQSCFLNKKKWTFTIHAKYVSGKLDIIRRSYDDIWALQVTLLSRFPEHSGHRGMPRLIPFLTPPQPGMSHEETKIEMNRYFAEHDNLPANIQTSSYYTSFFTAKIGDLANTSMSSDVGDCLLSLLDDIQPPSDLTIKLVLGQDIVAWREPAGYITYDDLFYEAEERLGCGFERLLYCDETNDMVPLYGDEDLRLLVSSSPNLKFFVE